MKNKNYSFFFNSILTIILLLAVNDLTAQHPPCYEAYQGLSYEYIKPVNLPPLTTDMPYDVIIGYMVIDSVCKNVSYDTLIEFLNINSFSDTIKFIRKVFYEMTDYNPFLFEAIDRTIRDDIYKYNPYNIISRSSEAISQNTPIEYKYDYALVKSGIISHVKVLSTQATYDSSAKIAKHEVIVNCQIIDTIKGKIIPECKNLPGPPIIDKKGKKNLLLNSTNYQLHQPGECLQFIYCLEWRRGEYAYSSICEKTMIDENNEPIIKVNTEYIIFLRPMLICDMQDKYYYSLIPLGLNSEVYTLYPVIDGIVQDPSNDFGFGTGLTANEFKNRLRLRINAILNF